ncbi:MAG TPA: hypothetical protein VF212_11700 [Longimicrobiales bacterium]
MPTGGSPDPVRSLAATRTGDVVLIRRILFGTLRALCTDLGVREGDVVHCRAGTASHLLLDTVGGRTVPLDRDWARFIQVSAATGYETAPHRLEADGAAV